MVSILIPVFNYNIEQLIQELLSAIKLTKTPSEIIVFNDNSSIKYDNKTLCLQKKIKFIDSSKNIGREAARQKLAKASTYDYLLFLDADVLTKDNTFISSYIKKSNLNYDAIFGGVMYKKSSYTKDKSLRYIYGKNYESKNYNARNKYKYRSIVSANFLIKKTLFLDINSKIQNKKYGNDILFSSIIRKQKLNIKHIDNAVYHLGLENNLDYLKKTEEGLQTYFYLLNTKQISNNENRIIYYYTTIKSFKLLFLFSFLHKVFKKSLKKKILCATPNITLFQIYRILYFCTLNDKANN